MTHESEAALVASWPMLANVVRAALAEGVVLPGEPEGFVRILSPRGNLHLSRALLDAIEAQAPPAPSEDAPCPPVPSCTGT